MKRSVRLKRFSVFLFLIALNHHFSTASAAPVAFGDAVKIHYVCRLKNGEIVATTMAESKLDPEAPRAEIFQPLRNDAPLTLEAGIEPAPGTDPEVHDLADEIAAQIAHAIVGLGVDEKHMVSVLADRAPYRRDARIAMARVRRRPMELRLLPEEYVSRTGKKAEIGDAYTVDPAFPGNVVQSGDHEVLIRFAAPTDNQLTTPFGPARVRAEGAQYLVEIQVQQGTLVRSGSMLGRVVAVNEETFTIDYGHPLAGQDLDCEVTVHPSSGFDQKVK